jgi:hypothetical protein
MGVAQLAASGMGRSPARLLDLMEISPAGLEHPGKSGGSSAKLLNYNGGLAQLARAPALHAGGHRFDSDILHYLLELFFKIMM